MGSDTIVVLSLFRRPVVLPTPLALEHNVVTS